MMGINKIFASLPLGLLFKVRLFCYPLIKFFTLKVVLILEAILGIVFKIFPGCA